MPSPFRFASVLIAGLFVFSAAGAEIPAARPFVHPGLLQNRQDLEFMKARILAGAEPWKGAFERLRSPGPGRNGAAPRRLLDFKPQPFVHVIRGAFGRPSIGGAQLSASADAAYDAALLWSVTGDRAYADKAVEIINAWSSTLWDFEDNDAKLLAAWTGHLWCNAAEILRYSDAGWREKDIRQFERMLRDVYFPLLENFESDSNGNWDAAIMDTMISMGVFLDDREMFNLAVDHYLRGSGNGGITKYVYPTGQCQETTRDAGHVQLGLGELAQTAQIAWTQGVDLYGAAGNRLALGLEYAAKYDEGGTVPIKGLPSSPGRLADVYQAAYQHYRTVTGLEMPFVAKAVAATQGRSTIKLLTADRAPAAGSPPAALGPPLASPVATDAGAAAGPTAQPPPGAIAVAAGESIQQALDGLAASGGWIVLGNGVHTLPAMLKLPSGVTLAGSGRDTILFLDPKLTAEMFSPAGTAIGNASPDLHDVTIRDLVVEGAVTTKRGTTNDPNQDRRARSYQTAPSRAGIAFLALTGGQMRNLRLDHVTVRNCTHNGVAIRGAAQVTIVNCDFSDSGASVMPGSRSEHNLVLTHVTGAEVRDSQFDTSPWGSGIDLTLSRDVVISGNEMARNSWHGLRVADCENVRISGNLVEGNDGEGVSLDSFMDGSRGLEVTGNLVRYNGQGGIKTDRKSIGNLRDNTLVGNGDTGQNSLAGTARPER